MTAENIFTIANLTVIVGWLMLAIAPRWGITRKVVLSGMIPLLLSAAYLVLIAIFFFGAEGGFGSLPDVMRLFTNEWVALAGWIHYLAFDLFVGSWEVRDSQRLGISHWLVVPCLFLTFMFGPVGLLAYGLIRFFTNKEVVVND